ncbi:MAG: helix-turn-helix domain-containing protein [Myxococcota bacterium]
MAGVLPMIQAAALLPLLRWLEENDRPVRERLAAVDLGWVRLHDLGQPVPLHSVAAFFREMARIEGADIGARVVSGASVIELAMLGKVALGARTPRESLTRVAVALPSFSTHEHIAVEPGPDGMRVRQSFGVRFDPHAMHTVQQFVASMIQALCSMTGAPGPLLRRVEMLPHPEHGFAHLAGRFGGALADGRTSHDGKVLTVDIDASVADRAFPVVARDRLARMALPDPKALRGDASLSGSARIVVAAMLADGEVTSARLARAAGTSVRTLQRRLKEEGTSFSAILEDVRREVALAQLAGSREKLASVSTSLGYARQSALTRAVRRWTGRSPRELRASVQT